MRQAVMVVGSFLVVGWLSGCSTDPVDKTIEDAITQLGNARTQMKALSSKLETMVKNAEKAKKDGKKDWQITKNNLKSLEKDTKALRKVGENFVDVEVKAKRLGEKLEPEKRAALNERYLSRIHLELKEVKKAYRSLVAAKLSAMEMVVNESVGEYLDEELRIALQEFESITRQ